MTARLHQSAGLLRPRDPLILTRATTGVATTCTAKDTWYGLNVGTMLDSVGVHPSWAATDIIGADHKIEPRWGVGFYELPVHVHVYSLACGTSYTEAENFTIGLFDVSVKATPALGATALFTQELDACPAVQAGDTLELMFTVPVLHTADLRFHILNRSAAAHDFEWDPVQISFWPAG